MPSLPQYRQSKSHLSLQKKRDLTALTSNFNEQNFHKAAENLLKDTQTKGIWDSTLMKKCENIDIKATQIMLVVKDIYLPNFPTIRSWITDLRNIDLALGY